MVAGGEAEIGIYPASEVAHVKGLTVVGPLPAGIELTIVYGGGGDRRQRAPEAPRLREIHGRAGKPRRLERRRLRPPAAVTADNPISRPDLDQLGDLLLGQRRRDEFQVDRFGSSVSSP